MWSLATTLALRQERKELKTLQESKDDLRESMSNTNDLLCQQLELVKRENKALRRQLRQMRKEQQKQDNKTNTAMTQEQKDVLTAWCDSLLVTYRIDFFRGVVLARIVKYLCAGGSHLLMRNIYLCQEAERLGFEADTKGYTELLRELRQITKEVPLSDAVQSVFTHVFGGEWEEAEEAIHKLMDERNEQK